MMLRSLPFVATLVALAASPALVGCGAGNVAPGPVPAPAPVASSSGAPVASASAPSVVLPPWASQYPATRADDTKDVLFGTEVRDPYRWLEDAKVPEVQAWMKAEDGVTRAKLAELPERNAIAARLKELYYVDLISVPTFLGGRVFYTRRSGMQEKSVVCWRPGKPGEKGEATGGKAVEGEKVLLDPNTWSKDGSSSLTGWSVSWDGKHVAYKISEHNSDEATMHVIDVATGKPSTVDVIPGAKYGDASWTPKGDGFYYVRVPVDPTIPTDKRPGYADLRFHKLGTDPSTDPLVHDRTGDPTTFIGGSISKDGRWLFAWISRGTRSTDVYFRDLMKPTTAWTILAEGLDAKVVFDDYKGKFYVRTNDGAPTWRVFVVEPAHPERSAWKEIVPARKDATLVEMTIVGGKLGLQYLKDVATHLEIHDLTGSLVREISLPAIGTASLAGDPDQDDAYSTFATFNYPTEIHQISIAKQSDALWFKQKLPLDPTQFVVEQVFVPSKDGTNVPMFVVRAMTTPRDGTAPAMLSAYGGFNLSMTPRFDKSIFPWLERGGVYALANLRGGGEYGEAWHRAGMRHAKQTVFDDFEAVANYLVKEKLTSSDRLAIYGGSNGGLLVGAALTQRPDLYRAVICDRPLLDMVRYHLFGSGRTWSEEYGTGENEADFRALFAYSPYNHVKPGVAYPSVLVMSADSDDRVDPMHARKMAAELQADSTGGPVLLRIEKNSGHRGADLVRAWVDEKADLYAFALAEIKKQGSVMAP